MGDVVDKIWDTTAIGFLTNKLMPKTPKTDTSAASAMLDETGKKAKRSRTQALSNLGGISGQELSGTQVSQQGTTLFGN